MTVLLAETWRRSGVKSVSGVMVVWSVAAWLSMIAQEVPWAPLKLIGPMTLVLLALAPPAVARCFAAVASRKGRDGVTDAWMNGVGFRPPLLEAPTALCHRKPGTGGGRVGSEKMPEISGLMRGKRGLIIGVANQRSLAWGIAKACHAYGAELAFTYQGDQLKKRVEPLAQDVGGIVVGHCDVTDPASIDAVFAKLQSTWSTIDFLVHAIAFSDKDQLDGRYVDTTAENFTNTMLISCYSLTAIAQRAEKLMPNGGSMLTLTYYGAEKWMPHYNVMGVAKAALEASVWYLAADLGVKNIRVNAISSGPIKTLAAAGIRDLRYIFRWNEYNAPLRRNVTIEDVGEAAVYLLSDMSRSVTGEIHHVDAGYHIVGMKHPDAPDIAVGKE